MKKYTFLPITALFCLSLFFFPLPVDAHKINIFAWSSDNTVLGETSFNGGSSRPRNAEIQVLNKADNRVLLTTRTNEKGKFSFTIPKEAAQNHLDLLLVVNAGEGHRGEWLLPAAEYLATGPEQLPAGQQGQQPGDRSGGTVTTQPLVRTAGSATMSLPDEAALRRIIDQELEKKLAPVKHMLARSCQHSTNLRDILGGIGYIIGLAGMAAWAKAGKDRSSK